MPESCQKSQKVVEDERATFIPIVVGALGTTPKVRKKDLENWRADEESRP